MKTISNRKSGSALISLTGILIIMSLLGITIIALTQSFRTTGLSAGTGGASHYIAESGARYAQSIYCEEGWDDGVERTFTFQNGDQMHIIREGDDFIVTSIVHPGTAMEARSQTIAPIEDCDDAGGGGGVPSPGDFLVLGNTPVHIKQGNDIYGSVGAIGTNAEIEKTVWGDVVGKEVNVKSGGGVTGNIYSSGKTHISQGIVNGDVYAGGDFILEGSSRVHGSVYAKGDIVIKGGSAAVGGHVFSYEGTVEVIEGGKVEGGDVRAAGNVIVSGGSWVNGEVHSCTGSVRIDGSGNIKNHVRAAGDITLTGGTWIEGDADAGGIIKLASSSTPIWGNATARLEINGTWVNGLRQPFGNPVEPVCPPPTSGFSIYDALEMQPATSFTAGVQNINGGAQHISLDPGSYGNATMGWNGRIYVRGGEYYFASMNLHTGPGGGLYIDLSNGKDVHLFVKGNVTTGSEFPVYVSLDGSNYTIGTDPSVRELAARIYLESHGNFTFGSSNGKWAGAVYTPYGKITVGWASELVGVFHSGGGHDIGGSKLHYVAPNYFRR